MKAEFRNLWMVGAAVLLLLIPHSGGALPTGDKAFDRINNLFLTSLAGGWSREKRSEVAGQIFSEPGIEDRLAEFLARLAERCVQKESVSELNLRVDKLFQRQATLKTRGGAEYDAVTVEVSEAITEYRAATAKEAKVVEAIGDLRRVVEGLGSSADQRAVPLIAPLLSMNGIVIDRDDYVVSPPQQVAAGALVQLGIDGVIDLPPNVTEWNVDAVRAWWVKNRTRYPSVPAALMAIERSSMPQPEPPPSPQLLSLGTPVPGATGKPGSSMTQTRPGGSNKVFIAGLLLAVVLVTATIKWLGRR